MTNTNVTIKTQFYMEMIKGTAYIRFIFTLHKAQHLFS